MLGRDMMLVGVMLVACLYAGAGFYLSYTKQQVPKGAVHVCTVMLVDEYTSVTRCIVRPLTVEDLEDVAASSSHTESNRQSIPDL